MNKRNPIEILSELKEKYGNKVALISKDGIEFTYSDFYEKTYNLAVNLKKQGIQKGEKICIFAENSPFWFMSELGAIASGCVSVPRQSAGAISELEHIYIHSEASVIITDKVKILKYFLKNHSNLKLGIYIGNEKNIEEDFINPDNKLYYFNDFCKTSNENFEFSDFCCSDLALIVYTSGTSGEPKGVMHSVETVGNFLINYTKKLNMKKSGKCINVLPLWHTAPRAYEFHKLLLGATIIYSEYENFIKNLKKYKPDCFICVPKFLITIYDECFKIISQKSNFYKNLFNFFYKISSNLESYSTADSLSQSECSPNKYQKSTKKKIHGWIYSIMDTLGYHLFYKKLKTQLLSENAVITAAGAKMSEAVELFFKILRIKILNEYGQTECFTLTMTTPNDIKIGSGGKVLDDVEIFITDIDKDTPLNVNATGLIKAKSKSIMLGYYKNEEKTNEIISFDRIINTGDIGYIDENNYLYIKGRLKDVIILNNGENIEPISIENMCKELPAIKQIVLAGQDKDYISAVVLPDYENCQHFENDEKLKEHLIQEINKTLATRKHFKWIERVRNILLIKEDFTVENGCLTNSYKTRRFKIYEKYANELNDLYNQEPLL